MRLSSDSGIPWRTARVPNDPDLVKFCGLVLAIGACFRPVLPEQGWSWFF